MLDFLSTQPRVSVVVSAIIPRDLQDPAVPVKETNEGIMTLLRKYPDWVKWFKAYTLFLRKDQEGKYVVDESYFKPDRLHFNHRGMILYAEKLTVAIHHARFPPA